MWELRNLKDKVQNLVNKYTEIGIKVREATNDEPWGPTGPQLKEIAEFTFKYIDIQEITEPLWERFTSKLSTWRNIYKSLLVIEHTIKYGSYRFIDELNRHIFILNELKQKTFTDDNDSDQSYNIKIRIDSILSLLNDKVQLEDERNKARELMEKFSKNTSIKSEHSKYQSQIKRGSSGFFSNIVETFKELKFDSSGIQRARNRNENYYDWEQNKHASNEVWNESVMSKQEEYIETTPTFNSNEEPKPEPQNEKTLDLLDFSTEINNTNTQTIDMFDPLSSMQSSQSISKISKTPMNFKSQQSDNSTDLLFGNFDQNLNIFDQKPVKNVSSQNFNTDFNPFQGFSESQPPSNNINFVQSFNFDDLVSNKTKHDPFK